MAQFARPSSDVSAGSWTPSTGSTLYETIDETSASDADYALTTAGANEFRVGLSAVTNPGVTTGHTLRVRHQKTAGSASTAITIRLRNKTDASTVVLNEPTISTTWTTTEVTLSAGEVALIQNYADLAISVYGSGAGGEIRVSWAELEVPDATYNVPILLRHREN